MSRAWTSLRFTFVLRTVLLFVFGLHVCLAQDVSATTNARNPDPSSKPLPSSTSSAPAQTHTVHVGLANHKFKPDVIAADVGDVSYFFPHIMH